LRAGLVKDPSFKPLEQDARFAQFHAASEQTAGVKK